MALGCLIIEPVLPDFYLNYGWRKQSWSGKGKMADEKKERKKRRGGTPLAGQGLGSRLPVQGAQVWSPLQGDPSCQGAAKPLCQSAEPERREPVLSSREAAAASSLCSTAREGARPAATRESQQAPVKTPAQQRMWMKNCLKRKGANVQMRT